MIQKKETTQKELKGTMAGFALVEMSIALMMFLLITFTCLEGGIILYDKTLVSAASRDAVRAGTVMRNPRLTDIQIKAVANQYASQLISFGNSTLQTEVTHPGADSVGTPLKVVVTYPYKGLILHTLVNRFKPNTASDNLPIIGSTSMYME